MSLRTRWKLTGEIDDLQRRPIYQCRECGFETTRPTFKCPEGCHDGIEDRHKAREHFHQEMRERIGV